MIRLIVYAFLILCGLGWAFSGAMGAACFGTLTYLLNPHIIVPQLSVLRLQLISSLVLMLMVICAPRDQQGRAGWSQGILIPLLFYWLVCMATILWARQPSLSQSEATNFGKTLLFVALLASCLRKESDFIVFGWTCIAGVFHGAFMHVIGTRFGYLPGRFSEEFGVFPDEHAGVLVTMVPMIGMYALYARTAGQRYFSWFALALVVVSIVNTYRRTPLLGLALQAMLLVTIIPRQRIRQVLPYALVLFVAVGLRSMPSDWWEKMATIMNPTEEASASSRFVIHSAYWQMALDHPMGVGYRNSPYVSAGYLSANMLTGEGIRSAHNTYLAILSETGFLGFSIWAFAVGSSLLRLNSLRKWFYFTGQSTYWLMSASAMAGLVGWCAIGWTVTYNELDPAYWFMGVAVALGRVRERQLTGGEIPAAGAMEEDQLTVGQPMQVMS